MEPEKSSDKVVTLWQSNVLTSARYELTKLEKNILYLAMREMQPTDPPGQLYYVSTVELRERTGEEIKYDRLRTITKKLLGRVLEADLPNGDLLQTHFFSSVQYIKGTGTLEISVDPKIRPFYGYLKTHFTTFQLDLAITLNSIYAKRFYEIFSMYKHLPNKVFRIPLDKLKIQLGLTDKDTGKDKYPLYADIKRNVLKPAEEINTVTDLAFTYREIKRGRKVVELEFTVVYTPKTTEIDYNEQETALLGRLVNDFSLRKDQAIAALRTLSPSEITKRLYQIKLQVTDGKVSNVGAYTAERLGVK
ncbi:replication initiation protein [Hymenobacter sp. H14-R3]|uniref:replication initiation protein n=1 Tax=Hymenobacter sp. H14-R3 TaxID=3046308 RepID=UPI0024B9B788|nr:replication initiation protein [Hymenobacter sp. H14-R3]MDJ0368017.1 replication initiation protein [Hymenobacter sp. H14-R3]